MKFYNTTKLALILERQAIIEGMKAENNYRNVNGHDPSYMEDSFYRVAGELYKLAELPDYIESDKCKKESKKAAVLVDYVLKFVDKNGYSAAEGEFSEMSSMNIYSEYADFCYAEAIPCFSIHRFANSMKELGYSKKRKADGIYYTIYKNKE